MADSTLLQIAIANIQASLERMGADQREMKIFRMDVNQAKTDANEEMKCRIGAFISRMDSTSSETAIYQDETTAAIRSSEEKTVAVVNTIRRRWKRL
jgi:predicted ABC-type ATPase